MTTVAVAERREFRWYLGGGAGAALGLRAALSRLGRGRWRDADPGTHHRPARSAGEPPRPRAGHLPARLRRRRARRRARHGLPRGAHRATPGGPLSGRRHGRGARLPLPALQALAPHFRGSPQSIKANIGSWVLLAAGTPALRRIGSLTLARFSTLGVESGLWDCSA